MPQTVTLRVAALRSRPATSALRQSTAIAAPSQPVASAISSVAKTCNRASRFTRRVTSQSAATASHAQAAPCQSPVESPTASPITNAVPNPTNGRRAMMSNCIQPSPVRSIIARIRHANTRHDKSLRLEKYQLVMGAPGHDACPGSFTLS